MAKAWHYMYQEDEEGGVSRSYRLKSIILKPDMLWAQQGGITPFFALKNNTIYFI